MPSGRPTPPSSLPVDVINALSDLSPEQLTTASQYADELSEHKRPVAQTNEETPTDSNDSDSIDDNTELADTEIDDRPETVPGNATLTVKDINDNRYYYWQWRDGDTIKSKYERPVKDD